MDWPEALEIVIAETRHEPYRTLCDDANPEHEIWRARVIARATHQPYPSVPAMAGNALGAVARVVGAVATGQPITVDQAELERRLAICHECEHFDAEQGRCRVCGCVARWKARLASEHCPLPEPKW